MIKITLKYILLLFIFLSVSSLYSQNSFKDEGELIKEANKLFEDENYEEAFEYYQTLLSNHKDNPEYNLRFGVCLLFSDRTDVSRPLFYLNKAVEYPEIDESIYYFLGLTYHYNYRFKDAIDNYKIYKEKARNRNIEKYNVDRRIEECYNGLNLFTSIQMLYVLNKVEVKKSYYYRNYEMDEVNGRIIIVPEELLSRYDKKNSKIRTAFYVPEARVIYFSSFGKKGDNGLDIYRAKQDIDGNWKDIEMLGPQINTKFDDAYPFVTADGKSIYFSSKGHNSIGGYDLYKSSFNTKSFSWSYPDNLNFPINTPFNDIFFAPDTAMKFAYFASNRASTSKLIQVYKIGLNKRPTRVQNLSKALAQESGDVLENKQIVQMSMLERNMDAYKYNNELKEDASSSRDLSHLNKDGKDETKKVTAKIYSSDEITKYQMVDTAYDKYKNLKYKLVELNKNKNTFKKIANKNKKKAGELMQNQSENIDKFVKYSTNVVVANEMSDYLDSNINDIELANKEILKIASEMQKDIGNNDTEAAVDKLNKIENIYANVYPDDGKLSKLIKQKRNEIEATNREIDELNEKIEVSEQNYNELKSESKDYENALNTVSEESDKEEYKELINLVDKKAKKEKSNLTTYKEERQKIINKRDSLENAYSGLDSIYSEYNDNKTIIDLESGEGIDETEKRNIAQDIYSRKNISDEAIESDNIVRSKIDSTEKAHLQGVEQIAENKIEESEIDTTQAQQIQLTETENQEQQTDIQNQEQIAENKIEKTEIDTTQAQQIQLTETENQEQQTDIQNQEQIAENKIEETEIDTTQAQQIQLTETENQEQQTDIQNQEQIAENKIEETEIDTTQAQQIQLTETENQEQQTDVQNQEQIAENQIEETKIDTAQAQQIQLTETENQEQQTDIQNQEQIAENQIEETKIDTAQAQQIQLTETENQEQQTDIQNQEQIAENQIEETKIDTAQAQQIQLTETENQEQQTDIQNQEQIAENQIEETEIETAQAQQIQLTETENQEQQTDIQNQEQIAENQIEETKIDTAQAQQIQLTETENQEQQTDIQNQEQIAENQIEETKIDTAQAQQIQLTETENQEQQTDIQNQEQIAENQIEETEIDTAQAQQIQLTETENQEQQTDIQNQEQIAENQIEETEIDTTQAQQIQLTETENQEQQIDSLNQEQIDENQTEINYVSETEKESLKSDIAILENDISVKKDSLENIKSKVNSLTNKYVSQSISKQKEINQAKNALLDNPEIETERKQQIVTYIKELKKEKNEIDKKAFNTYNTSVELDKSLETLANAETQVKNISDSLNSANRINTEEFEKFITVNETYANVAQNIQAINISSNINLSEIESIDKTNQELSGTELSSYIQNNQPSDNIETNLKNWETELENEIRLVAEGPDEIETPVYEDTEKQEAAEEYLNPNIEKTNEIITYNKELKNSIENYKSKLNNYQNKANEEEQKAEEYYNSYLKSDSETEKDSLKQLLQEAEANNYTYQQKAEVTQKLLESTNEKLDESKQLQDSLIAVNETIKTEIDNGNTSDIEEYNIEPKLNEQNEIAETEFSSKLDENEKLSNELDELSSNLESIDKEIAKTENKADKTLIKSDKTDDIDKKEEILAEYENLNNEIKTLKSEKKQISNKISDNKIKIENNKKLYNTAVALSNNSDEADTITDFNLSNQSYLAKIDSVEKTGKSTTESTILNNLDLLYIRKAVINRTVQITDAQIDLNEAKIESSDNLNEIAILSNDNEDLNIKLDSLSTINSELETEIADLEEKGFTSKYADEYADVDLVYIQLNEQAQKLRQQADSIRNIAQNESFFAKRKLNRKAEAKEIQAYNMELTANEYTKLYYENDFAANQLAIQQFNLQTKDDLSLSTAKELENKSETNYRRAQENRDAAKNPALKKDEKLDLLQDAKSLNEIAINQQNQALGIYKEINPELSYSEDNFTLITSDTAYDEQVQITQLDTLPQQQNQNLNNTDISETEVEETEIETAETETAEIELTETETTQITEAETVPEQSGNLSLNTVNINQIREMSAQEVLEFDLTSTQDENLIREVEIKRADLIGAVVETNPTRAEEFYNEANPVEIKEIEQEGLIYKVQIAASRRLVSGSEFPGIKPLSVEDIPNSAYYRYMAGLFTSYDKAITARNDIRTIGYEDAFIVPYFNGERITNARARRIIAQGIAYTDEELASVAEQTNNVVYQQTTETQTDEEIQEINTDKLFYSVQIGAYSNPRSRDRLNNLPGLFYNRTSGNRYYKYFTGQFASLNDARTRRALARNNGFGDAFIVAFNGGNKVSVQQAQNLENAGADIITGDNQTEDEQNTSAEQTQENETVQRQAEEIPDDNIQQNNNEQEEQEIEAENINIVFKVQLGAYSRDVPVEVVNQFINLNLQIDKFENRAGLTIYTTGEFDNYQDANMLRNRVVENGIPDAFLVAYNNDERITIEEALNILNR